MKYAIRLHAKIKDDFDDIPVAMQTRIKNEIRLLADNPRPSGVRKLSGIKRGVDNVYRVRVGNYRIAYQIFDRELFVSVIAAAERGSIYQKLRRRLR